MCTTAPCSFLWSPRLEYLLPPLYTTALIWALRMEVTKVVIYVKGTKWKCSWRDRPCICLNHKLINSFLQRWDPDRSPSDVQGPCATRMCKGNEWHSSFTVSSAQVYLSITQILMPLSGKKPVLSKWVWRCVADQLVLLCGVLLCGATLKNCFAWRLLCQQWLLCLH